MLTKRKRVPFVSQYGRNSFLYTLRFANKSFRFAVTKHFVLRIIICEEPFFLLLYKFLYPTPLQAVDFSPYSIQGKRGGQYMWR